MRIGIIGCTNLTKAMIRGILAHDELRVEKIMASDVDEYELLKVREKFGIKTTKSRIELVENSDVIILAERARYYSEVAQEIKDIIKPKQILISIAPNMTIAAVAQIFGEDVKIVRAKPNTPAMVGESMTGICCNGHVTHEEFNSVCNIMRTFGVVETVDEKLMDVVIAVSSSSPAYVFMFIEAMADAASADGMPRKEAYEFAAQAVLGSAKMILETGKHPGELKDMVCSPGGTTLEAIRVLENHGLRSSVFEAVKACAAHCKKM